MANGDMIIIRAPSGSLTIEDRFSTGYAVPSLDGTTNTNLEGGTYSSGTYANVTVSRALSTGDTANDNIITLDAPMKIHVAVGGEHTFTSKHTTNIPFTVVFSSSEGYT
mmetsp:Transcript_125837/g.177562  ORF Transcript_125837/g.177562 Transcript_125837/m.177562 type:complete len:109 (+) Transcript_125837:241-567(+)